MNRKREEEMRRKGDMERHVKEETGQKNLHKEKKSYTQINTISIQMKQRKTTPMQTDRICMHTALTDFTVMLSSYNYRQKGKAYLYRIRLEV